MAILKCTNGESVVDDDFLDYLCKIKHIKWSITSKDSYVISSQFGKICYLHHLVIGKGKHLGYFENKELAAIEYNKYASNFFGKFSKLNVI